MSDDTHVAWCRYSIRHGRPTRIILCDSDAEGAFPVFRRQHGEACRADKSTMDVCDGTYKDKLDSVTDLCEALRAVYALAGENPEVTQIINEALRMNAI